MRLLLPDESFVFVGSAPVSSKMRLMARCNLHSPSTPMEDLRVVISQKETDDIRTKAFLDHMVGMEVSRRYRGMMKSWHSLMRLRVQ